MQKARYSIDVGALNVQRRSLIRLLFSPDGIKLGVLYRLVETLYYETRKLVYV